MVIGIRGSSSASSSSSNIIRRDDIIATITMTAINGRRIGSSAEIAALRASTTLFMTAEIFSATDAPYLIWPGNIEAFFACIIRCLTVSSEVLSSARFTDAPIPALATSLPLSFFTDRRLYLFFFVSFFSIFDLSFFSLLFFFRSKEDPLPPFSFAPSLSSASSSFRLLILPSSFSAADSLFALLAFDWTYVPKRGSAYEPPVCSSWISSASV